MTEVKQPRLRIYDVTGGNTARLGDLENLLGKYFPCCPKYLPILRRRASNCPDADGRFVVHQWLVDVDDKPVGFLLFDYVPARDCGICLFIGINPEYRDVQFGGHRLAQALFDAALKQLLKDAQRLECSIPLGLLLEVELQKLVTRYREYGFVELAVNYQEPIFPEPDMMYRDGLQWEQIGFNPVTLGMFPLPGHQADLTDPQVLKNLSLAFLVDFYNLPPDSQAVQNVTESVHLSSS
jgi:GNAT superfamily N-acetyltransferase